LVDALKFGEAFLSENGIDNPRLNAETLLSCVLNLDRLGIYLSDTLLSAEEFHRYRELLRQRAQRIPLQYITGETDFYSVTLSVDRRTFIPRPETEVLVEALLERLRSRDGELEVADVGTGCGAIAVSMARELRNVRVYATDISGDALSLAKKNAFRNGVAPKVRFLEGDALSPLEEMELVGRLDAMASNPPYIPSEALDSLPEEVRLHEPRIALDGGPEGLYFYRRVIPEAGRFLKKGGILAFEVGDGQAGKVCELMGATGDFGDPERVRDLNGIERVVLAVKL